MRTQNGLLSCVYTYGSSSIVDKRMGSIIDAMSCALKDSPSSLCGVQLNIV